MADGSYVFVGTESDIQVYDVSVPSSPTLVSQYAVGAEVRDLAVSDGYLYAATSSNTQEVLILSLAQMTSLTVAGSYDLSGSTDAASLSINGDKLYVGRENNSSTNPELYQFDRTDPVALVQKNAIDVGGKLTKSQRLVRMCTLPRE